MKNFRKIFVLITVTLLLSISHTAMAMEGEGTEESPFLITNQAELETMDSFTGCHFRLENDIVLEGEWTPLCKDGIPFTGVLDGNGYEISNLTITFEENTYYYLGLFRNNAGTIKNLQLKTSKNGLTSLSQKNGAIGGIVYKNEANGIIEKCSFSGKISCGKNAVYTNIVGGISAVNDGIISECYSGGEISSNESYISGISGSGQGRIINCYSKAIVNAPVWKNETTGIGDNAINCYFIGGITSENPIGDNSINSFYDRTITGISTTEYGTPKTTIAMKMKKTYTDAGWDFDNVWGIDDDINDGYPYLLWEYPEESSATTEIIGATSTDSTLKFISEVSIEGEPEIAAFGTTFIPLWLFETGSADTATVEYDNSNYNITNAQTYGATLTGIPESCKSMDIVGKSYIKDSDGIYTWSAAKYSSVNNPILNSME